MDTGDAAGPDDVLENTVCLEEDMLAVDHLYLAPHDGIDERQFGELAVVQFGHRLKDLLEGRFLDEHRMEDAIRRVGFGILPNTAAGEGSVTDVHGEKGIVHRLFAIYVEDHMLGLMLDDSSDESEEVVDRMRTDIVLELFRFLAAERVHAEADRVDEIPVVLDVIAPIGDAAYVDGMSFALEETAQGLFMVLGERPVASPVITRSAGHKTDLDLGSLLGREVGPHDTVDGFGERTVSAEDEDLVVPFLHQLTRQLDRMSGKLGHTVGERQMPLAQQVPQVDTLCTESFLARFRIDDDAEHKLNRLKV